MPYYPRTLKQQNLAWLREQRSFTFYECDLRVDDLSPIVEGVQLVIHEAAMAGLVASWSEFDTYMTCNLQATQRLLEAIREIPLQKFVHIPTSSVYGRTAVTDESGALRPVSPYGVAKLAAERLALAYNDVYEAPTTILRYFSVYGPRQRPDMGYHILIDRILRGEPIIIYGDGEQTRGNTYIADCVSATTNAATCGGVGEIYNIGGGEARSVNWVINQLQEFCGRRVEIRHAPPRLGDQRHTFANIDKARRELSYQPSVPLAQGLAAQVEWQRSQVGAR